MTTLLRALFGTRADESDTYPVLKDVSLDIFDGEAVGVMGRNGAGKTTLLSILGNVMQPTSGIVEKYGRTATLLGLTAGFSPNFSGRENARLFCSIQGLSRTEIDERIGSIERFAELGRYFEMPLRTYSSGMQSRLAFSCAVHVDAELIIIDETLAVGDANFRMKCYRRIEQMKRDGQTFLLVSHNQNVVANYCSRVIVLEGGGKVFDGDTFEGIEVYKRIRAESSSAPEARIGTPPSGQELTGLEHAVQMRDFDLSEERRDGGIQMRIRCNVSTTRLVRFVSVSFGIRNHHGIAICTIDGSKAGGMIDFIAPEEPRSLTLSFSKDRLLPGRYFVTATAYEIVGDVANTQSLYQNILSFDVVGHGAQSGIVDLAMTVAFET